MVGLSQVQCISDDEESVLRFRLRNEQNACKRNLVSSEDETRIWRLAAYRSVNKHKLPQELYFSVFVFTTTFRDQSVGEMCHIIKHITFFPQIYL